MFKKADLEKIADILKVDKVKFVEAGTATEEKDVELPKDLQSFTKAEIEARDRNQYNKGGEARSEMLVKDLKKKKGIDIDGEDLDKVVEALEKKAAEAAGVNPDERLKEKDKEVERYKSEAKKANDKAKQLEAEKADAALDSKLLRHFPKERNSTITDEEYLALIKSRVKFSEKDGKEVVSIDGKVMEKADTFEPIPLGEALKGYFTERKWTEVQQEGGGGSGGGGRGGDNSKPGAIPKFAKLSEVKKYADDNGINFQGSEGVALMKKAYADNPQLDTTK